MSEFENEENVTVTLMLDNDEELECDVLTLFEAAGRSYIALAPVDDESEEVFFYRYEVVDGEPTLGNIMDDKEYDAVCDAFEERLNELEMQGMLDEEE